MFAWFSRRKPVPVTDPVVVASAVVDAVVEGGPYVDQPSEICVGDTVYTLTRITRKFAPAQTLTVRKGLNAYPIAFRAKDSAMTYRHEQGLDEFCDVSDMEVASGGRLFLDFQLVITGGATVDANA